MNWFNESSSRMLGFSNPGGLIVNCVCPNSGSMRVNCGGFYIVAPCES